MKVEITIHDILVGCGGPEAAARSLRLSYSAVRKWEENGIPWWHWRWFLKADKDLTAGIILTANQLAMKERNSVRR
jgi:hypothetical protein